MVERLQLSLSEGTKKLESESIQIDPIVPETSNLHGDTNQETKQATVQLNIVEDDESVTSEPCCADCLNNLIFIFFCITFFLVFCSLFVSYIFLIGYLISLDTTASKIFGGILLFPLLVVCTYARVSK